MNTWVCVLFGRMGAVSLVYLWELLFSKNLQATYLSASRNGANVHSLTLSLLKHYGEFSRRTINSV